MADSSNPNRWKGMYDVTKAVVLNFTWEGFLSHKGAQGSFMSIPRDVIDCPSGLEYLSTLDQLLVRQEAQMLEAFAGYDINNKYTIKNSSGQKVYLAIEETNWKATLCCGQLRPFDIKIMDSHQNEVIHLRRTQTCMGYCFEHWFQRLEVTAPPGTVIGSIEQQCTICKPTFVIKNAAGKVELRIKGPISRIRLDVDFKIYSTNGENQVGKITKKWLGLRRELLTDVDHFEICFPMDLDVRTKAMVLGACFLIDFMFFEA